MKCFYHSADLDGHCSGAIIKLKYPECEMLGINYGEDFPFDSITEGETVFMVDFCLQPFELMLKLAKLCKLVWIDHHQTAIDIAKSHNFECNGVQRVGIGACALVWEYLYPYDAIPLPLRLLAEYDVWNHTDPRTLPFQYGMRLFPDTSPESDIWDSDMWDSDTEIDKIINKGELILSYEKSQNEKFCKTYTFESDFDGMKAICVNRGFTNSQLFESVYDPKKHDLMISFVYNPKTLLWNISLYSDKEGIDCGAIAKNYGGGGHKGAAGFQSHYVPFLEIKGDNRNNKSD